MRSGRLRHIVQLQRPHVAQDDSGQPSSQYETFDWDYADIEALQGRELFAAQQVQSQLTTKITMRYRRDVDSTVRVLHQVNGNDSPADYDVYDIESAAPDRTQMREIVCLAVKRDAEGWRSGDQP
jgi:SPP1 family predicted phage head-tail adaptor